jgi:hypothetical protein
MNAIRGAEGSPQQALQLGDIQTMTANDAAVEKEDRDVQAVATLQDGIAVDVDDFDGRQSRRASQCVELGQHLIAQLAVVAMDDRENRRGHLVSGAGLHGVGNEAHGRGRHLAYRRHLVTVDDGREGGR